MDGNSFTLRCSGRLMAAAGRTRTKLLGAGPSDLQLDAGIRCVSDSPRGSTCRTEQPSNCCQAFSRLPSAQCPPPAERAAHLPPRAASAADRSVPPRSNQRYQFRRAFRHPNGRKVAQFSSGVTVVAFDYIHSLKLHTLQLNSRFYRVSLVSSMKFVK